MSHFQTSYSHSLSLLATFHTAIFICSDIIAHLALQPYKNMVLKASYNF